MEEKKITLFQRFLKLTWTTSKILSFLIFGAGCIMAIYLKEKEPFLDAIMYATINQGVKNIAGHLSKLKSIVKP